MKNFDQAGDIIRVTCPAGGKSSGDGVQVGAIFGVATADAEEAAELEIKTTGVFYLEKVEAQAWTVGIPIFYDDAADKVTSVGSGNILIGVSIAAAANPSTHGRVRLNGAFVVEPAT